MSSSWMEPRALLVYDPLGTALYEMGELILVLACLRTVHIFIVIHGRYHKPSLQVGKIVAIVSVIFTCIVIGGAATEAIMATTGHNVSSQLGIGNYLMYGAAFVLEIMLLVGAHIYCNQVLQEPSDQRIARTETRAFRESRKKLLWLMRMVQLCCGLELILVILSVFKPNNWIAIPMNTISILGSFMMCYVMGRVPSTANQTIAPSIISLPAPLSPPTPIPRPRDSRTIKFIWPRNDRRLTSPI